MKRESSREYFMVVFLHEIYINAIYNKIYSLMHLGHDTMGTNEIFK